LPGDGHVVALGDHDRQRTLWSVQQAAVSGGRYQIQIHSDRTHGNQVTTYARGGPGLGKIDPWNWRLDRFQGGSTNQGGLGAHDCSQPPGPGQGVGRVRRGAGPTAGHHRGHRFIQGVADVLIGAHFYPGVAIVAAHAHLKVTVDDPGHLQAEYLAPQHTVLNHGCRSVSAKKLDERGVDRSRVVHRGGRRSRAQNPTLDRPHRRRRREL
jgi:hypothetical protein